MCSLDLGCGKEREKEMGEDKERKGGVALMYVSNEAIDVERVLRLEKRAV